MTPGILNLRLLADNPVTVRLLVTDAAGESVDLASAALRAALSLAGESRELVCTVTDAAGGLCEVSIPSQIRGMGNWEFRASLNGVINRILLKGLVTVSDAIQPGESGESGDPLTETYTLRVSEQVKITINAPDLAYLAQRRAEEAEKKASKSAEIAGNAESQSETNLNLSDMLAQQTSLSAADAASSAENAGQSAEIALAQARKTEELHGQVESLEQSAAEAAITASLSHESASRSAADAAIFAASAGQSAETAVAQGRRVSELNDQVVVLEQSATEAAVMAETASADAVEMVKSGDVRFFTRDGTGKDTITFDSDRFVLESRDKIGKRGIAIDTYDSYTYIRNISPDRCSLFFTGGTHFDYTISRSSHRIGIDANSYTFFADSTAANFAKPVTFRAAATFASGLTCTGQAVINDPPTSQNSAMRLGDSLASLIMPKKLDVQLDVNRLSMIGTGAKNHRFGIDFGTPAMDQVKGVKIDGMYFQQSWSDTAIVLEFWQWLGANIYICARCPALDDKMPLNTMTNEHDRLIDGCAQFAFIARTDEQRYDLDCLSADGEMTQKLNVTGFPSHAGYLRLVIVAQPGTNIIELYMSNNVNGLSISSSMIEGLKKIGEARIAAGAYRVQLLVGLLPGGVLNGAGHAYRYRTPCLSRATWLTGNDVSTKLKQLAL